MKLRLSLYILTFALVVWYDGEGCERNIQYTEFTDIRDGQTYKAVKMPDNKTWMAQNLNYKPIKDSSWCYDDEDSNYDWDTALSPHPAGWRDSSWCYGDEDSNCVKYGRLYNWDAAQSACPAGWRLPTEQDWNDLIKTAGRSSAGMNLKSKPPLWDGRDRFGFSALPGGCRNVYGRYGGADGMYLGYGYWWSATTNENYFYRWMCSIRNDVIRDGSDSTRIFHDEERNAGFSIRCVQDETII